MRRLALLLALCSGCVTVVERPCICEPKPVESTRLHLEMWGDTTVWIGRDGWLYWPPITTIPAVTQGDLLFRFNPDAGTWADQNWIQLSDPGILRGTNTFP